MTPEQIADGEWSIKVGIVVAIAIGLIAGACVGALLVLEGIV